MRFVAPDHGEGNCRIRCGKPPSSWPGNTECILSRIIATGLYGAEETARRSVPSPTKSTQAGIRRTDRISVSDAGRVLNRVRVIARQQGAHSVESCHTARLDEPAAGLAGNREMIQITPQMRVLVAIERVDGRKGLDSLARLCQEKLAEDPFSGCVFVFRSRSGTAIRLLSYDLCSVFSNVQSFANAKKWRRFCCDQLHITKAVRVAPASGGPSGSYAKQPCTILLRASRGRWRSALCPYRWWHIDSLCLDWRVPATDRWSTDLHPISARRPPYCASCCGGGAASGLEWRRLNGHGPRA